jgi:type I restriction enzyme, S subunit
MAPKSPIINVVDWPEVTIAGITTKVGSGATPRGGAKTYLNVRSEYALIRSQNVLDRQFDRDGLAYITNGQAEDLRGVILQRDDILLNITGDGVTFGRACIVPEDVRPACVNQHVSIIRVDPEKADAGYVLSFLTHPDVKPYIESFNAGGSRRAITKGHIESFRLSLPPLRIQRVIAHILGTLDDKIESNRQARSILRELGKAKVGEALAKSEPRRIALSDLTTSISRGITPMYADGDTSAPLVLNQKCVRDNWVSTKRARHMVDRDVPTHKKVEGGDILVNSTGTGTLGRVGRWHTGTVFADSHLSIVKPDPIAVGSTTLAYLIFGRQKDIEEMATGSTGQTELSPSRLGELMVNLPARTVAVDLEEILISLENRADSLLNEEEQLTALRDTLLPGLLSGRISVPEHDAAAAEVVA